MIENGSKWGITVHNSHYGLIRDNVVFNTGGAGIMTEDGSETGNIFEHNFVVAPTGPGGDDNDLLLGRESSGLWFRGPHNVVRNNVVANSFVERHRLRERLGRGGRRRHGRDSGVPGREPGEPTVGRWTTRACRWASSAATRCTRRCTGPSSGTSWRAVALETWEGPTTLIKNTTLWHMGRYGAFPYGTNRMVFEDWTHLNDPRILSNVHENPDGVLCSATI